MIEEFVGNDLFLDMRKFNALYSAKQALMPSVRLGYYHRWNPTTKCYDTFFYYPPLAIEPTSFEI